MGLHDLDPRSGPARAQGARRRRCGDIVDNEQRSDRRATPLRPSDSGVARASAALPLLDDVPASPASRPLLILGQAPVDGRNRVTFPFTSL